MAEDITDTRRVEGTLENRGKYANRMDEGERYSTVSCCFKPSPSTIRSIPHGDCVSMHLRPCIRSSILRGTVYSQKSAGREYLLWAYVTGCDAVQDTCNYSVWCLLAHDSSAKEGDATL